MGVLAWLLGSNPADDARANCHGRKGVTAYQQTLVPGDIGYLCNSCGQSLLGGFLGLGYCRCSK